MKFLPSATRCQSTGSNDIRLIHFNFPAVIIAMLLQSGTAMLSSGDCPTVDAASGCPQGCWHGSGITLSDGSRHCEPVGSGYFSSRNDDNRLPCPPGTFSNIETAEVCVSCPAGTHASIEGTETCHVCPPSTYSGMPRSTFCALCDPTHYSGDGANGAQVWNGNIYCTLSTTAPVEAVTTGFPTKSPSTTAPTSTPTPPVTTVPKTTTEAPSDMPLTNTPSPPPTQSSSTNPTSSIGGSTSESGAPTFNSNGGDGDDSNGNSTLEVFPFLSCDADDEFEWHGFCRQCPSTLSALLHPVWILLFLASVISLLRLLPPCCIGIFWLGIEYLQFLYLLGLTPLSWTAILQRTFYGILSVFALDLDASFSWQCLMDNFDIPPTGDHIWVLCIPFLVWMVLCAISKLLSSSTEETIPITRWMAIGLYLGYVKLLLTSLELIRCTTSSNSSSWFCSDQLFASIVGVIGIVGYGVGFPLWFLWNLRRSADSNTSPYIWMYTTFPFQTTCWWWTGFWMVRKGAIVVLIVTFRDQSATIILTTLLVALMLSEILQRAQPIAVTSEETNNCNGSNQGKDDGELPPSHRWFKAPNVDLILQSCMILLTALSFVSFAVSAENALALGIFFLIVFIPSMIYWIVALCHCNLSCNCGSDDKNSNDTEKDKTAAMEMGKEDECKTRIDLPKPNLQSEVSLAGGDGEVATLQESSSPIFVPDLSTQVPHCSSDNDDHNTVDDSSVDLEAADVGEVDNGASLAGWAATYDDNEESTSRMVIAGSDTADSLKRSDSEQSSPENTLDGVVRGDNSDQLVFDDDMTLSWEEEEEEGGEDNASLEEIWIDEATGLPVDPGTGDWTDAETGRRVVYDSNDDMDQSVNDEEDDDEMEHEDQLDHGVAPPRTKPWVRKMETQPATGLGQTTGNTLALDLSHRVEPVIWGTRQSAGFQPNVK